MAGILMSSTSGIKKKDRKRPKLTKKQRQEARRVTSWSVAEGYRTEELSDIKLRPPRALDALTEEEKEAAREKARLERELRKEQRRERALIKAARTLVQEVEDERENTKKLKTAIQDELEWELRVLQDEKLQAELGEHAQRVAGKVEEMKGEALRQSKRVTKTVQMNDAEVDKVAAMLGLFDMGRKHRK